MAGQVQEIWAQLAVLMRSVQPTTEWIAFASRTDHLLDPDTPLRNPEAISYPGKDDPSVIPVHSGILERKHRFTKSYHEGYFVLTPAGWLHQYRSSDLSKHPHPEMSLFLPECTLGAPSTVHSKSHKFHLEAGKKSAGGMPFSNHVEYSFRARSHDEVMEWWNDAKQLSKVYLTTSEAMDRSGPVPAAVRAMGYASEEEEDEEEEEETSEEETSEEEEGSSEEEEEEEEEEDTTGHHHEAVNGESAPNYEAPAKDSGEGTSGYPVRFRLFPICCRSRSCCLLTVGREEGTCHDFGVKVSAGRLSSRYQKDIFNRYDLTRQLDTPNATLIFCTCTSVANLYPSKQGSVNASTLCRSFCSAYVSDSASVVIELLKLSRS